MEASTRICPALLDTTDEIAADGVDEEAVILYYYFLERCHNSNHNITAG
jgi:hypothetical protein